MRSPRSTNIFSTKSKARFDAETAELARTPFGPHCDNIHHTQGASLNSIALRTSLALALILLTLSSCAKKADTVAGPSDTTPNAPGTPVTVERRTQILDTLSALDNSLSGLDPNTANQKLLNLLRSMPEIAKAGISPGGAVWATFTDRRVFIKTSSFENTTLIPNALSIAQAQTSTSLRKVTDNLPTTKTATVLNALGTAFEKSDAGYYGAEQTRKDIGDFLTSAGYSVRPGNDASVNGLKQVNGDDAVFHMTAHGEEVTVLFNDKDSVRYYCIWTSDQRSPELDAKFQPEFDAEELCYLKAPNTASLFGVKDEVHYAITPNFVLNHMHFGLNSLVYITACFSGSPESNLMVAAFGSRGASVYAGWSTYVQGQGAFYAARFFFDRALGMNRVKPTPNPPQRPFEYYLVHEDMQYRGIDKTTAVVKGKTYSATLSFNQMKDDFAIFLPTIQLSAITDQTKLYIDGTFGKIPGVVKFNGSPLTIDPWKSSTLSMVSPPTGGLLWVEVNGLASNKIPLTEWDGTITYTYTGRGTLEQTVTLNLVFIADVHRYRSVSGADQIWADNDYWGGLRGIFVSPKSSGSYVASGEYRDPTTHEVLESWTGGGSIPAGIFPSLTTGFSVLGMVDSVGSEAQLILSLSAPYSLFTKPATINLGGLGSIDVPVKPGFVLPPWSDSSGTAKLTWSGSTPDPRYVQKPTDQR